MEEERTITLDLGSSPDPLIDPVLSPPMMPPSAIKKKSQAAERLFTALAPSPRKQTFELDVGDEGSPQRLLVTVEADDEGGRRTSRRLFQSPTPTPKQRRLTPRMGRTVTTTTVPLRGLSDDEGSSATPKRRGRPRKSGTPATTRRKRPGTPAKGRATASRASVSPKKDIPTSDIGIETTPRPSTRPRATKRKASSPAKEDGAPGSQPRKRGRPRKSIPTTDDTARLEQRPTKDPETLDNGANAPSQNQPGNDMDDIWLATMSDQPTPIAPKQRHSHEPELSAIYERAGPESQLPRQEPAYQDQYDWPDMGGGGADSYSEAESMTSDQRDDQGFEDTAVDEGFTMISIGSLPSMQPHSSVMAPAHEELGEATSMIINGALESLRQSQNRSAHEASAEVPDVLAPQSSAAATQEENTVQQHLEPELAPPRSPRTRMGSPRRGRNQSLARQLAQKSLQEGDRESPAPAQPPVETEPPETSAYEDSFSEIPEDVLVAATPHNYRHPKPQPQLSTEEPNEDIQPSIERPSRVHSNPQSETNRLLTPDETPSPNPSDDEDHHTQLKPLNPSPVVELPSSPPIENPVHPSDAAAHHIRRSSTETPADQLSSFTSSNMGVRDVPSVRLPVPEPQHRPSLSPIVRAGRALQTITSDPPSPPGRDSMLGSPFRGSVRPSHSPTSRPPSAPSAAPATTRSPSQPRIEAPVLSPSKSWLAPLSHVKEFFVRKAQSLSPARVSVSGTDHMDDPFGPDPGERPGSNSLRNTLFSGPNKQSHDRDATVSVASSTGANPVHDDDAMSWPGEGSPAGSSQRSGSPDQADAGARELPSAVAEQNHQLPAHYSKSAATAEALEPQLNVSQHNEAHEEQEGQRSWQEQDHEQEEDEEDDDIWAIEAQRPTPYAQKLTARQEPVIEPPRRGKIPSPWRQNSRRLTYSDELEQYSDKNAPAQEITRPAKRARPDMAAQSRQQVPVRFEERNEPRTEEEESSMLSRSRDQRPLAAAKPPINKSGLDDFFSSPAVLPDMQAAASALSRMPNSQNPGPANAAAPKPRTLAGQKLQSSGNSLFAQYLEPQAETEVSTIQQKRLEIGSHRRSVDLFSPVRKSVERSRPEHAALVPEPSPPQSPEETASAQPEVISRQQPLERPGRLTNFAPRALSPDSEEETRPEHIWPKMNFTPRRLGFENDERTTDSIPRTLSPSSDEEAISPERIPQKKNFTPRQRQYNNTLFQPRPVAPTNSLFGNSQVANFFAPSRPDSQRPRATAQDEEEYEEEESSFAPPPLRPLPDPTMSPGKSALRSPLKQKTPGPVIKFASSTLSPLTQAQARAEQRASMSPEKGADEAPERVVEYGNTIRDGGQDKENHSSASSSSSLSSPALSPSPSPSPPPRRQEHPIRASTTTQQQQEHNPFNPFSPTTTRPSTQPKPSTTSQKQTPTPTWTRAHWLRLDALLQARKHGTLQFQLELARPGRFATATTTSPTTDHTSGGYGESGSECRHLLGKQIRAQGESVTLQGWHLDVVEGFLGEMQNAGDGVGSGKGEWDAVQIAKRVFALLVGEERRRLGLVPAVRDGLGMGLASSFSGRWDEEGEGSV